ncbi:MAG: molybdopterin molybdotransferase MoeA, partial [Candidatus Baldrarchaeota archaeon]
MEKFRYTDPDEALKRVLSKISPENIGVEEIYIHNAFGRVLAEDIVANMNIPPGDVAHFDGYAVRHRDTLNASLENRISLKIIDKIFAGEERNVEIKSGETCYVATGAYLPKGADTIVPIEHVRVKNGTILLHRPAKKGDHVIKIGEDIKSGEILLRKGHALRAQDLCLLATLKRLKIKVYKKPRVAIISIGDELTDNPEETSTGKTFISNFFLVVELVRKNGGEPINLGVAPDEIDKIKRIVMKGLEVADIVITIGGISVGEKDYVCKAVNSLGSPGTIVRGLKVKPGRQTSVAIINGKPVLMLPGLIQSTFIGFIYVGIPLLKFLSGQKPEVNHVFVKAVLKEDVEIHEYK